LSYDYEGDRPIPTPPECDADLIKRMRDQAFGQIDGSMVGLPEDFWFDVIELTDRLERAAPAGP
jgi:hypothetical protein